MDCAYRTNANIQKMVSKMNLFIRKYLLRNAQFWASQVNNSACQTKRRNTGDSVSSVADGCGWFKFYNDQVGQEISFACSEQRSLPLGRLGQFHIRAWRPSKNRPEDT